MADQIDNRFFLSRGNRMARLIMRICGSEDQKLGEACPRETFAITFESGKTLAKIFQEYADKRLGSPLVSLNLVDGDSGQKKPINPVDYCPEDGDLIEQSVSPLP